jgi:hypothetical protein
MALVFPDDVLDVIRALSKPVFQHYEDYNAYVRIFQKDYPELKAKLSVNDEDTVAALRVYLDSDDYLQQSGALYKDHMARPRPDNVRDLIEYRVIQHELHEEDRYASWWSCRCHRALVAAVREEAFEFWESTGEDFPQWERTPSGWQRIE